MNFSLASKRFATTLLLLCAVGTAFAEDVTSAQRRAAGEYLAALAGEGGQSLAYTLHPAELDRLRIGLMSTLRDEAGRGDSTVRARLFGSAVSQSDVERWTSLVLFTNLSRRLALPRGRVYEDLKGIAALKDGDERVIVIVRGKQPRDRGQTQVVEMVTLLPYGKDWKAALPGELEAQVEDMIAGRDLRRRGGGSPEVASGAAAGAGAAAAGGGTSSSNSAEILAMLAAAEKALVDGRCDEYYKQYLSPNFRKTLSSRIQDSLVANCRNSLGIRESLIAALRIVRRLPPKYEYDSTRATYDVSGQGLAFDRFVLEQIDKRWYVAE